MKIIFVIGAGSFIGGVFRYLLSQFIHTKYIHAIPFGTLSVNIIGSFLIGIVFGLAERGNFSNEWRLFLATGVIGGFTTFSSFSHETVTLMRDGNFGYSFIYMSASILLSLLATFIGIMLTKLF